MNLATFERARLAAFVYDQARHTGSLDCMKAVAYVMRNRVQSGWGDGSWLSVLELAASVAGNEPPESNSGLRDSRLGTLVQPSAFSANPSIDRLLQLIVRDIDDIYLDQDHFGDNPTERLVCGDKPPKSGALYYSFVDRDPRTWFIENIVRQPLEHPQTGTLGTLMLFR